MYRGAYAKKDIAAGEKIEGTDIFLAMPNIDGQLVANQMSKYNEFYAEKEIKKDEPIMLADIKTRHLRKQVIDIIGQLKNILVESKVALPPYVRILKYPTIMVLIVFMRLGEY